MEDGFWEALREIAHGQDVPVQQLLDTIAEHKENYNFSSALRVYVLTHYRALAAQAAPSSNAAEKHPHR